MRVWIGPFIMGSAAILLVAFLMLRPVAGQNMTAIFPLHYDFAHSLAAVLKADVRIVRSGPLENAITVSSERPDLAQALYDSGAVLVVNGGLFQGCGAVRPESVTPRRLKQSPISESTAEAS